MHALNQPLQVLETGVFVAREIVEEGLEEALADQVVMVIQAAIFFR